MQFDPYAICPGGRDKKIRFCCPDMLKEIEQVGRLLESNQTGACLAYIESLEKNHPNCACLTTAKLAVYRSENRWKEALPVAERFHAQEPDNPTAAAEYALVLIVNGNPQLAVATLVDAFERTKADSVHSTLLHAALQVSTYLLLGGLVVPAIAIGNVLKEIPAMSESANALLYRATSETSLPLLIRDWAFDYDCPENFPGKEAFEEAAVLVRLMRWKQALAQLESLTQYADTWSGIVRNTATIHLWLLDRDKGCEALKTYASLPNTQTEDAVDAETLRLLFSPDIFGDQTQLITAEYTITDADKALEKLHSVPLFYFMDQQQWQMTPHPRGSFVILDRPVVDSETALTIENISSRRTIAFLFGKETDQEARLAIMAIPGYIQEEIESAIREALGDLVQFPGKVIEQKLDSRTQMSLECNFFIPPTMRPDRESLEKLIRDHYMIHFAESWLNLSLGSLDGKTPNEAAKEPKYTIPLLAAIQVVESMIDDKESVDVAQNLRSRLGLPTPDMITVAESSGEDPLMVLDAYPVWRWHRFDVAKLSTEVLSGGLQIVLGMREDRAAVRFAEELLNRPMDSMDFAVRVMAFEALISASQVGKKFDEAILWIERAKNESAAQNVPDAAWCLHEIVLRLLQGETKTAFDIIQYVSTKYRDNESVMQSLQELFMQLGLLNPDGTPSAATLQAAEQRRQSSEHQALWTPDGGTAMGPAASSKLWVPD